MLILYLIFLLFLVCPSWSGLLCFPCSSFFDLIFCSDESCRIFSLTLSSISFCVLWWSYFYIDQATVYRRFYGLVVFFLFSMFGLVYSCSLLTLFIFWDLLGFSSLFLVLWYSTRGVLSSGIVVCLSNRVGDVFFFMVIALTWASGCSAAPSIFILVTLVSMTKSAQVPFSAWLPLAISAPTPVSALVHSSTLVTAGVYLLYRFSGFLPVTLLGVGLATTLLAGIAACAEVDVKNVVALSTLSHLGLMFSSLGLGLRGLTFFHLNVHASIKALLFLGIGGVIHLTFGSQELRYLSSFVYSCPLVGCVLLISNLSLCGLPFLSGWFSKEAILGSNLSGISSNLFALVFFFVGVGLTSAYSFRLLFQLFTTAGCWYPLASSSSGTGFLRLPIFMLASLSIFQGGFFQYSCLEGSNILMHHNTNTFLASVVLGVLFAFYITSVSVFVPSPLSNLSTITGFISWSSSSLWQVGCLESSHSMGFGLSRLGEFSFLNHISNLLFNIKVVILFPLLLLCL